MADSELFVRIQSCLYCILLPAKHKYHLRLPEVLSFLLIHVIPCDPL